MQYGDVGVFAVLLCFGLAGWAAIYAALFAPYVAYDQHHVAQGRLRRRPSAAVARLDISHMTRKYRRLGTQVDQYGQLIDENGRVLMELDKNITTRQLEKLAQELHVPFQLR